MFLLVLIFFDATWMLISRLTNFSPAYFTSSINIFPILIYVLSGIVVYAISVICSELLGKINTQIKLSLSWRNLVVISFILNFYLSYNLPENYRYVDGSFTLDMLSIYYLSTVMNALVVCSYFVIQPTSNINNWYPLLFLVGMFISIDGLSRALFFVLILYSFYGKAIRRSYSLLVLAIPGVILIGFFGLMQKGSTVDIDYIELAGWVAARMAIPAETAMQFLVGDHFLKSFSDSLDLLGHSFNCRVNFFTMNDGVCSDIKSIGGANFYSLYGIVKGGSSSGYLTSIIIGNIAALPLIMMITLVIGKLFRQIRYELNFFEILCLYFALQPLHANFLDAYTILSIVTITLVMFIFVFLFCRLRY